MLTLSEEQLSSSVDSSLLIGNPPKGLPVVCCCLALALRRLKVTSLHLLAYLTPCGGGPIRGFKWLRRELA